MNFELPEIEQKKEAEVQAARRKLELEGWRPLDEPVYLQEGQRFEDIKDELLEPYTEEGFDQITSIPMNPYEKDPKSFYVYVSNPLMRGESEIPTKSGEKKQAA